MHILGRNVYRHSVEGRLHDRSDAEVDQALETVSGRIETERSGNLTAKSISGAISFASTGETLDINSTSGRIDGEILALDPGGSVDIDTVSGAVDLEVFPELDADLKLQSVSGSISCDFPVQITEQKRKQAMQKVFWMAI